MILSVLLAFSFGYIIIDHTSVEKIDDVSDEILNQTYYDIFLHYAHTSHGGQIIEGMQSYLQDENERYQIWQYSGTLPTEIPVMYYPPGLRFFDGQDGFDYITPEEYWATDSGRDNTREVLDTGLFTHSMFAFCGQMATTDGPEYATSYTTQMEVLEGEYPDVTFIYMTGHLAGSLEYPYTDDERENLRLNNEHVRDYVVANNKVLYDFADIESYFDDAECLTNSNPTTPMENFNDYPVECDWPTTPEFYCAHSAGFNCVKKAKAFWYLMASLVVDDPGGGGDDDDDDDGTDDDIVEDFAELLTPSLFVL